MSDRCAWQTFNIDRSRWRYCEKPWRNQCKHSGGLKDGHQYKDWEIVRSDWFLGWEHHASYYRTLDLRKKFVNLCPTSPANNSAPNSAA